MSTPEQSSPGFKPVWQLALGRTGTVFADQLTELLILWFVWELSRSSTVMGFAAFAGRAPFWLFGFYGASLVDRYGPLRLLVLSNTAALAIAVAVASKLLMVGPDVATFVILAFVLNSVRAVEAAALGTVVPLLAQAHDQHAAHSWFDNAKRVGRLTAPLLSRWLGLLHPAFFLLLAAVAYGVMAVLAKGLTARFADKREATTEKSTFGAVLRFVKNRALLYWLFVLSAAYSVFHGVAYFAVLPRLSFDQGSAENLGWVLTMVGLGGIAANLVIANIHVHRHVLAVACGMVVAGLGFAALSANVSFHTTLCMAFILGCSLPFQDVFVACAIQAMGAPDIIARLHATWRLACEFTLSLGILAGGYWVDHASPLSVGLCCGVLIVVVGLLLALTQRRHSSQF